MSILPLILEDVSLRGGGRALLDAVSFEITAGPKTVVLGPNGAGKSLLLRLCHGLIPPSAGTIRWAGPDAGAAHRRQAMVFQKPVMLRRSVRANVTYGLALQRIPVAERRTRIDRVLERTGLAVVSDRPARVLSVGEQQRLALARAWALEPEVLFLDEPTANLDPAATGAVEGILEEIHRARTKIVMTTHDLAQARRIAEEVVFVHNGRVTERGPAARFFDGPSSEPAAAYLEGRLLW